MKHASESLSVRPYIIGFVGSLILTIGSYSIVSRDLLSKSAIIAFISVFAFLQFIVQMIYFLHLGKQKKARWRLWVFLFMAMVVFIIVAGSIWIMNNLNYHLSPEQMYQYLNNQGDGI